MTNQQAPASPGPPMAGSSDRGQLAQVALAAALTVPGVVGGAAGRGAPRVTMHAGGRLVGVAATAQRDGRYSIDLRLIAHVVPLRPLADAIRARVQQGASRAGLAGSLGSVDVEFADLLPAEPALRQPEPRATPATARAASPRGVG